MPEGTRAAVRRDPDAGTSLPRIPLLTTSLLDDVRFSFLALPMWWILGIEQLVWLPLGVLLLAKLVAGERRLPTLPDYAQCALAFVVAQLLSGLFVAESYRYLTFGRNWLAYVATIVWMIVVSHVITDRARARQVLAAIGGGMTLAAFLGLVGITGVWRPEFRSPVGWILPGSVRATSYGRQIAERQLGDESWFILLGQYFRVESVFTFSTMFAFALACSIPLALWLRKTSASRRERWVWTLSLFALAVNLIWTTGRISIISVVAAGTFVWLLSRPVHTVVATLVLTLAAFFIAATEQGQKLARNVVIASSLARGAGSLNDRGGVYRATIEGIAERPFFGWGTERDVVGLPYPAGSHSYYLGVLYKHGVVGALTLVAFLGTLTVHLVRAFARRFEAVDGSAPSYGLWILLVMLLNSLTDVPDLDVVTLLIAWISLSVFVAFSKLNIHQGSQVA